MSEAGVAENALHIHYTETPLGWVRLIGTAGAIIGLDWPNQMPDKKLAVRVDSVLARAAAELAQFFCNPNMGFTVPLKPVGTPFQQRVWHQLRLIPPGITRTYGAVANATGGTARAVGQACGANPLPLFIPCHRVVGQNSLGGFSAPGALTTKAWLLAHEGAQLL